MNAERGIDQRGVDPQKQSRVAGPVAGTGHALVDGGNMSADSLGLVGGPEDDRMSRGQGLLQPGQGVGPKVAVLGHAPGHERMSQLQQEGAATTEQKDQFAVNAPNDRIREK